MFPCPWTCIPVPYIEALNTINTSIWALQFSRWEAMRTIQDTKGIVTLYHFTKRKRDILTCVRACGDYKPRQRCCYVPLQSVMQLGQSCWSSSIPVTRNKVIVTTDLPSQLLACCVMSAHCWTPMWMLEICTQVYMYVLIYWQLVLTWSLHTKLRVCDRMLVCCPALSMYAV